MRAVITVIGEDKKGIVARTSTICWESNVNILDITQSIVDHYFTMTMVVDLDEMNQEYSEFKSELVTELEGLKVLVMNEDIFKSMHRI